MVKQKREVDVPCSYEVVGEHVLDPALLLVMDDEAHLHALNLRTGETTLVEPGDEWAVDTCDLQRTQWRVHLN
jgi:hypothetical protein